MKKSAGAIALYTGLSAGTVHNAVVRLIVAGALESDRPIQHTYYRAHNPGSKGYARHLEEEHGGVDATGGKKHPHTVTVRAQYAIVTNKRTGEHFTAKGPENWKATKGEDGKRAYPTFLIDRELRARPDKKTVWR